MTITTFRKMAFRRWFGMALIFMMIPAFSIAAYAETGVNVAAHTQDEIRNYINQNGPKYVATSFAKEPDKTDDGYHMGDQGALSTETMQDGLKMLNAIRYIAGLSADVSLDDDYTNQAQAGAFINDINKVMDHTPAKPEGMDEDLYNLGYAGTRSSNLSWASFIRPLANITLGWMSDETGNNLTTLGHRRWQINPKLKKVGFGQSGYFTAIRVHDTSGTGQETGVVWPARNMPVDFFSDNLPWSYSLGSTISDASVQLELIRGGEKKKTWSFHTKSSEPVNSGFYYNIDNDDYGQKGCIIFRPDNVSYHAGDSFKVTISGGVNAEYTVNFFALVPVESFTIPESVSVTERGVTQLGVSVVPENASDTKPIWSIDNENVATIDNNGKITAVGKVGDTATITAELGGYTKTCKLTIGIDMTAAKVQIIDADRNSYHYYYTGLPIIPKLKVLLGETELKEDQDYTVSFPGNVDNVNQSNYYRRYFIVEGCGRYAGKITSNYIVIDPRPIDEKSITEDVPEQTYTGSEVTPEITLTYNKGGDNERVLTAGEDYEVKQIEGEKINAGGAATVSIEGKGNYTGVRNTPFTISPKDLSESVLTGISEKVYTGKEQKQETLGLSLEGYSPKEGTDYTVSYLNNVNAGSAESENAPTVIVTGQGNYTGTVSRTFNITQASMNNASVCFKDEAQEFIYNGEEYKPDVVVSLDQTILPEDDYVAEYKNNIDAGTSAIVIVKAGKSGNLTGSATPLSFEIKPADISEDAVITLQKEELVYNAAVQKPGVTSVELSGRTLIGGTDYEVSHPDTSGYTNPGTYSVRVTGMGNYTGVKNTSFAIIPAPLDSEEVVIELEKDTYDYSGRAIEPAVTVKISGSVVSNNNYTVSCQDNQNAGTGMVTVTAASGSVLSGSKEQTFPILPRSITNAQVTLQSSDVYYNGKQQKPEVSSVSIGDLTLRPEEYTVSYGSNVEAGEGQVTITAAEGGNYKDAASATFNIQAVSLGSDQVTIEVSNTTYTGTAIAPAVSIKIDGNEIASDNFSVSTESINAGSALATITAAGSNLTGSANKGYDIQSASLDGAAVSLSLPEGGYVYTGSAFEPTIAQIVTTGGLSLTADDYTVEYANNINVGTAVITVTGKGNYKNSVSETFEIKPAPIDNFQVSIPDQTYSSQKLMPIVTVSKDGKKLQNGRDFSFTPEEATNAGDHIITVTGKGNYKGTVTGTFKVNRASMDDVLVSFKDSSAVYTYTGELIEPAITVSLNGIVLPEADYEEMYSNNENAGTNGSVIAKAKEDGNLTGTSTALSFEIKPADISEDAVITLQKEELVYNAAAQKPGVTSVELSGRTLNGGTDFVVSYPDTSDYINPGTYSVRVTGKGNYTGTAEQVFTISPADLTEAEITPQACIYTGAPVTAVLSVHLNGAELQETTDYTVSDVSGQDYTKTGQPAVKVVGCGNYTGEKETAISILPADISTVIVSAPDQTWTGSELRPAVTVKLNGRVLPAEDYTVEYANNIAAGTASILVKPSGNGNLSGESASGTFVIKEKPAAPQTNPAPSTKPVAQPSSQSTQQPSSQPAQQPAAQPAPQPQQSPAVIVESITIPKAPASVKAKAKKNKVTVSWKKIKKSKKTKALLAQIHGIELQYSTEPGFPAENTVKVSLGKKKTKLVLKGLQPKTVYYVRVRYTDGSGGYSNWSKVKAFRTK